MPYTDDPGNIPADQVRFLVGDTSVSSPVLTDNQISFLLDDEGGDPVRAAARAAEVLAARASAQADLKQVGPLRIGRQQTALRYQQLAKTLWARANSALSVFAGGTDRPPSFTRDMMNFPRSSGDVARNTTLDRLGDLDLLELE